MTRHPDRPACLACGRPVADQARLCSRPPRGPQDRGGCAEHLERELSEVPALAEEVQTTRLRQSRTGGAPIGGGHTSERPLPWDDRPVQAAHACRQALADWTMLVVAQRGARMPAGTLTGMSRFLAAHLEWLRHRDEAADAKQQIEQAVRRLRASVDRRAELQFVGPCRSVDYDEHGQPVEDCEPCPADVYVRAGARVAVCQVCRTEHDVAGRRAWMLDEAQDQLVTAAELSRFLTVYGEHVTPDRIAKWAERGRLAVRGHRPAVGERRGAALFRVGDARELLLDLERRQVRREAS